GQLAVDTEGEVHFILRADMPGQCDRLADDALLDNNRSDEANQCRWRCCLSTSAKDCNCNSKSHAACAYSHVLPPEAKYSRAANLSFISSFCCGNSKNGELKIIRISCFI